MLKIYTTNPKTTIKIRKQKLFVSKPTNEKKNGIL